MHSNHVMTFIIIPGIKTANNLHIKSTNLWFLKSFIVFFIIGAGSEEELRKQITSMFNPLSPNSTKNEISLYIITTCPNNQVMRIKKVITKDKMSWYLDKFSLLVPKAMFGEQ